MELEITYANKVKTMENGGIQLYDQNLDINNKYLTSSTQNEE